ARRAAGSSSRWTCPTARRRWTPTGGSTPPPWARCGSPAPCRWRRRRRCTWTRRTPRRTWPPRRTPGTTTPGSPWTAPRTTSCSGSPRRRSPASWAGRTDTGPLRAGTGPSAPQARGRPTARPVPIVGGGGYVFRHGDAQGRAHRLGLDRHAVPRRRRGQRGDERRLRRARPGTADAGAVPGALLRAGAEVLRETPGAAAERGRVGADGRDVPPVLHRAPGAVRARGGRGGAARGVVVGGAQPVDPQHVRTRGTRAPGPRLRHRAALPAGRRADGAVRGQQGGAHGAAPQRPDRRRPGPHGGDR